MWLQRDFGLLPVNIFDTEKACQVRYWQAVRTAPARVLGVGLHGEGMLRC